VIFFAVLMSE